MFSTSAYLVALEPEQFDFLIDHVVPIYRAQILNDIALLKREFPNKRLIDHFASQLDTCAVIVATLEEMAMGNGLTDLIDHLEQDHGVNVHRLPKSEENVRWLHRELHKEGK